MEFDDKHASAYVFNGHKSAQADAQNKYCVMEQREYGASAPNGHSSLKRLHANIGTGLDSSITVGPEWNSRYF